MTLLFGPRVADEVALAILTHLEDPLDLLRLSETCRHALHLAGDRGLWQAMLRRSPHERAVRWCSMVLDGVPPHLAYGATLASAHADGADNAEQGVSIIEWLHFFARQKRALMSCLQPHCSSDRVARALVEILLSRNCLMNWLAHTRGKYSRFEDMRQHALMQLPSDFVYHFLIIPLMEECLAEQSSKAAAGQVISAVVSRRWTQFLATTLTGHYIKRLMKTETENSLQQLFTSDLCKGSMELDPARVDIGEVVPENKERLLSACEAMIRIIQSLQFPLEVRMFCSNLYSGLHRLVSIDESARTAPDRDVAKSGEDEHTRQTPALGLWVNPQDEEEVKILMAGVGPVLMRLCAPLWNVPSEQSPLKIKVSRNFVILSRVLEQLTSRYTSEIHPSLKPIQTWLEENRDSLVTTLIRCSTVTNEEAIDMLRRTVKVQDQQQSKATVTLDAHHASVIKNDLQAYAGKCLSTSGQIRPLWLHKRMFYLYAPVLFTIKMTCNTSRMIRYVEYKLNNSSKLKMGKPLTMQKCPTYDERDHEWQGELECPPLAEAERPINRDSSTMGLKIHFGLFHRSPDQEKHASLIHKRTNVKLLLTTCMLNRQANPSMYVATAVVTTDEVMARFPNGSIILNVPYQTTTSKRYRSGTYEKDAKISTTGVTAAPPSSSSSSRIKSNDSSNKEESGKRGFLRGLMHKLGRSNDGKRPTQADEAEEEISERPHNIHNDKEKEEDQVHISISFSLRGAGRAQPDNTRKKPCSTAVDLNQTSLAEQ